MGERGWAGWSGVKGGKWDNCNSIINKYIKKKLKDKERILKAVTEKRLLTRELP